MNSSIHLTHSFAFSAFFVEISFFTVGFENGQNLKTNFRKEEEEEEEEEEEGEGGRGKDGKERQCKLYSIEYLIMFIYDILVYV